MNDYMSSYRMSNNTISVYTSRLAKELEPYYKTAVKNCKGCARKRKDYFYLWIVRDIAKMS